MRAAGQTRRIFSEQWFVSDKPLKDSKGFVTDIEFAVLG
jgi:hypothetical protein